MPKQPKKKSTCQINFGDGTPVCKASVSSSSSAPKAKKNTFGKGVKSGNKLKGGKALVKQKKRAAKIKAKNATPPTNQKHANPRFL